MQPLHEIHEHEKHEHERSEDRHHRLVNEIATSVEEKLIAKFAKWVFAHGFVLLVAIISGIAAFYDVKHDVRQAHDQNVQQERRIDNIEDMDRNTRDMIDKRLEVMSQKLDEINRFLRDHNQSTREGFQQQQRR